MGLIGSGLVLAVVLALPEGGVLARPLHDGFFIGLGVCAWLVAVGLVFCGARVCAERRWTPGALAAAGSGVVLVSMLGLLGLTAASTAGIAGGAIAMTSSRLLGSPAAATLMAVGGCLGLVLAFDLEVAGAGRRVADWWTRWQQQRRENLVLASEPVGGERVRGVAELEVRGKPRATRRARPAVEAGPAPRVPAESLYVEVEPPAAPGGSLATVIPTPEADDVVGAVPDADNLPGYEREFEGVVVERGGAVSPPVGAQPAAEADEIEKIWLLPSIEMLDTVTGKHERLAHEVKITGATIVNTLRSFGIETRVLGANMGPTVTQFELQPAVGVPVRRILGYQTDISLALAAPIRIQPFIPGKSAIGIEVPNKAAQLVTLKEIIQAPAFSDPRTRLGVALGADVSGHPVIGDLTRMPHLLIAGATGSGKSVSINAILGGFLLQATPAQLKLVLIDPKRVELSNFADLPHLLVPVVVEPDAAVASLRWAVKEMEERYKLFASHGARNIATFNERAPNLGLAPLPYTVIVIDELADLMIVAAGEIEDLICRIAQLARAVGIHLIVATQRPSADIITGLIKANIPSRVAFAVSSGVDSRVILDEMGAEKLLGRGDMLYLPIDEGKARRLQGAFVSDRELDALIGFWKAQGQPDYQEEIFNVESTVSWAKEAGKRDPLFARAAHTVAAEGRAAASLLQRKLSIGYTRAARLVDQLAEHRIIGPYEGSKSREILMDVLQVDEYLADLGEE